MKKVFKMAICLAFFGLFFGVNNANGQKNGNYITVDYNSCGFAANMPESFRNFPMHKYDGTGSTGTILPNNYELSSYFRVGYRKIFANGKLVRFGYDLAVVFPHDNAQKVSYVVNPGLSPTKYGSYLAFCETTIAGPICSITGIKPFLCGISIIPAFVMESSLAKNTRLNPKMFVSTSYQTLMAVNGWDKTNLKTIHEQSVLAHMFPINLGLGANIFGDESTIVIGLNTNLFFKTKNGQEFQANAKPVNFFAGINLEI